MNRASLNALPDDPDWCGHLYVSLRTWTCADCARPVTPETRRRMESAPTKAPAGSVWVLLSGNRDLSEDGFVRGMVDGLYTDRARIAALMIRGRIYGAADIRDVMRRTHWYQCVFNVMEFEGWEEEPDESGEYSAYDLSLVKIDRW